MNSRRQFIKNTSLFIGGITLVKPISTMANNQEITYLSNPNLNTIKQGWQGNKLINGRFVYDPPIPTKKSSEIIKWKWGISSKTHKFGKI